MSADADLKKFDALFQKWKKTNPTGTFSQFTIERQAVGLKKGRSHASLGFNLSGNTYWWHHGQQSFDNLIEQYPIPTDARICDYGCGSLRIGVHFIKRQEPESYFGLDVTEDFIAYGKKVARDLLKEKSATVGTIEERFDDAVAFNPDIIYAANVVSHIHPDEIDDFYSNIKKLAHSSGAIVVLHVAAADKMTRFKRSGWAWPMEAYQDAMAPLTLIKSTHLVDFEQESDKFGTYLLTFQRP